MKKGKVRNKGVEKEEKQNEREKTGREERMREGV